MSNLLKVRENPLFLQWYKWVDVSTYVVNKDSLSLALKQPDTIQFYGKYQAIDVLHEPKNGVLISSWTSECWKWSTFSSMFCPILKTKSAVVLQIETMTHSYPPSFSSGRVSCKGKPSPNGALSRPVIQPIPTRRWQLLLKPSNFTSRKLQG